MRELVAAVVVWPPLVRRLPRPLASAVRVPPPSPVVGVAFLLEVAVDVEEVVRMAVQVVVRVAVPWQGTVADPVVVPWQGIARVPVAAP